MISRISDLYIHHSNATTDTEQAVQIINIQSPIREKRQRIAAYCRVSTEKEAQLESLETQLEGFKKRISKESGWELVDVYVDQGASGTSVKNRSGFQDMYTACTEGKIDCILTKSISRFARNTVDCLSWIEKFKQCGVPIIFEKEGIDTRDLKSQMALTVMSCFAQEESRSISENVKWGMQKLYQSGREIPIPVFGYRHTKEEQYIKVPEEAEVVRTVFSLYSKGYTPQKIIQYMEERHVPPPAGDCWKILQIHRMLHNEKYIGDVVYQKNYVESYLTHKEVRNRGEIPFIQVCNIHPAIIERPVFIRVQKIIAMRRVKEGNSSYPYGDMLKCPYCGKNLFHGSLESVYYKKQRILKGGWGCYGAGGCRSYMLIQQILDQALIATYDKKYHIQMKNVDFYWIDESMASIQLKKDNTVHVCWKDGSKTIQRLKIEDIEHEPRKYAERYNVFLEKVRSGKRKTKNRFLLGLYDSTTS